MVNSIKSIKVIEAGNSTFTVSNNKGEHFTYRVRQPSPSSPFFASVMTSSDNINGFTYAGIYDSSKKTIIRTGKSCLSDDAKSLKVLKWAIATLASGKALPEGYAIQHDGKCCKCGRKLTTPESIDKGIGPECAKSRGL